MPERNCYETLVNQSLQALDGLRFKRAAKLAEWAFAEALKHDRRLQDRAYLHLMACAIEIDDGNHYLTGARSILGASKDPEDRFLAAYNLSAAFGCESEASKAMFYAQIAAQLAEPLADPAKTSIATYQLGLLALGTSKLQEAQKMFETSIRLFEGCHDSKIFALQVSSLGYCQALQGQFDRSLALLNQSVEILGTSNPRLYAADIRLNFGFSLLEMENFDHAHDQGKLVLSMPVCPHERKYALYLLAETSNRLGHPSRAREYFQRLQTEFYPQMPFLVEELLNNSISDAICWTA